MTWTYTGDPAHSDLDAVRFLIQDTTETTPLVTDEEIAYALGVEHSALGAAAFCLETLARRYASSSDLTITSGPDTVKRSGGATGSNYAARAAELRARANRGGAPWFGGGSVARKDQLADEADRVQPMFRRGQFSQGGL